jgi:hypothetical protein
MLLSIWRHEDTASPDAARGQHFPGRQTGSLDIHEEDDWMHLDNMQGELLLRRD